MYMFFSSHQSIVKLKPSIQGLLMFACLLKRFLSFIPLRHEFIESTPSTFWVLTCSKQVKFFLINYGFSKSSISESPRDSQLLISCSERKLFTASWALCLSLITVKTSMETKPIIFKFGGLIQRRKENSPRLVNWENILRIDNKHVSFYKRARQFSSLQIFTLCCAVCLTGFGVFCCE